MSSARRGKTAGGSGFGLSGGCGSGLGSDLSGLAGLSTFSGFFGWLSGDLLGVDAGVFGLSGFLGSLPVPPSFAGASFSAAGPGGAPTASSGPAGLGL